jgi:hypothetical protein
LENVPGAKKSNKALMENVDTVTQGGKKAPVENVDTTAPGAKKAKKKKGARSNSNGTDDVLGENKDDASIKHPSYVVVVRDGGKVLVPFSVLQSDEQEFSGNNTSVVATHLCSKDKASKQSQSGKETTPSKTSTGKKASTQSKSSGATATTTSKKRKERSSDVDMCSRNKITKVASNVVPSNADDSEIVELADGTQVTASEVQIVEVADSSQVYEADQPFRPIVRVDDAKVRAHKRLFYEQLEGHYTNLKTFKLMTRADIISV